MGRLPLIGWDAKRGGRFAISGKKWENFVDPKHYYKSSYQRPRQNDYTFYKIKLS